MKRIIIALVIVVAIIAGLVLYLNQRSQAPAGPPGDSVIAKEIKPDIVLKHSSANDCWVAIGGSVYRLDNYFSKNPNDSLATQLCGKIEPDTKLPVTLKTEALTTYRIGLLSF